MFQCCSNLSWDIYSFSINFHIKIRFGLAVTFIKCLLLMIGPVLFRRVEQLLSANIYCMFSIFLKSNWIVNNAITMCTDKVYLSKSERFSIKKTHTLKG